MTRVHLTEDDLLTARLEDLSRRQRLMHRMAHPDPRDPDYLEPGYTLEETKGSRYDWVAGRNWMQPAPKRGGV